MIADVKQVLKNSAECGIARPQALRDACAEDGASWPLLNLELWFKIFIDRDPDWLVKTQQSYPRPLKRRTSPPVSTR